MLLIASFFSLLATLVGYNLPRQISTSIAISTAPAQRFQSVSSASTSFTSSQLVSQLKAEFLGLLTDFTATGYFYHHTVTSSPQYFPSYTLIHLQQSATYTLTTGESSKGYQNNYALK